jgi:hypothetical protein
MYGRCWFPTFSATGNMIASAYVAPNPMTTAEMCRNSEML